MKFLSQLGAILLKGVQIYTGFAPVVQAVVPGSSGVITTVSKDLAQIAQIIADVEVMGQALNQPGTAKLTAAAPLVAQVILQSSLLVNHQIADPLLFNQGAQKVADGIADVLNSLKTNIQTVNKA